MRSMRHRCMTRFTSCFLAMRPGRGQRKQLAGAASLRLALLDPISVVVGGNDSSQREPSGEIFLGALPPRAHAPSKTALRVDAVREVDDADDLLASSTHSTIQRLCGFRIHGSLRGREWASRSSERKNGSLRIDSDGRGVIYEWGGRGEVGS